MKKKRKKKHGHVDWSAFLLLILMILVIIAGIIGIIKILMTATETEQQPTEHREAKPASSFVLTKTNVEPTLYQPPVIYPSWEGDVQSLTSGIESSHAVLIDLDNHTVLADKGAEEIIYPASMTKLMTLIVAIEHTEDLNEVFVMTDDILAPLYAQNASMAGFQSGEECTVLDLLYGAALPSGGDATAALALHTAGSEEQFVQWMNEKVAELELKNTHFTNPTGLHHPDHYSTVTDIALILDYCMQNELCRQIISTYTYQTDPTPQSPEGITMYSTMFSRMYGTEVEGITILGGKTGFTDEAGNCLASYAQTSDGHTYLAVTAGGLTRWKPVFDAFKLYGIITGTYAMDATDTKTDDEEPLPSDAVQQVPQETDATETGDET
ncbi:MAG: D-alanyl-D-alanine carboxypeptidase [Oscillospiraceae bacterium]|nr:D-alanyl-D-alanine carboxypeptidase [Oscillospiraceae bacterium]